MDGNCLFSAVALSAALTDGTPDQARARAVRSAAARLRSMAMDVLCPAGAIDAELMMGGLPATLIIEPRSGEDGAAYCKRLRKDGEWGSTAEVLALSHVLERSIRVHTPFGVEVYGSGEVRRPLAIHFEESHYQAMTEELESVSTPTAGAVDAEPAGGLELHQLRGGAAECDSTAAEAAVAAVLDALHAAAARADATAYFECFARNAVFMGTDPGERWPVTEFRGYVQGRFDAGDGWEYITRERHVTVDGGIAWFDERLDNSKLGPCRGTGVMKLTDGMWKLVHYSLTMAIPNAAAVAVAAFVTKTSNEGAVA